MDLVNARIVTGDVAGLASFYAALLRAEVVTNDYYAEVPTGVATIAFSCRRFLEPDALGATPASTEHASVILDFMVDDVDEHYDRIRRLGVEWIMAPTDQPWGNRSMMFRDPEGNIVNVFAPAK